MSEQDWEIMEPPPGWKAHPSLLNSPGFGEKYWPPCPDCRENKSGGKCEKRTGPDRAHNWRRWPCPRKKEIFR